jgi:hypothetical protein
MVGEVEMRDQLRSRRLKIGALAYRNRIHRLSDTARHILFQIEAGNSLNDIVDAIAWSKYHPGPSTFLTPEERRPAQVEVMHHIREIRTVFGLL